MKPQLSLDDHRQLGAQLFAARTELMRALPAISKTHRRDSKQTRAIDKAIKAVDGLRALLDNEVAFMVTQEHWDRDHLSRIYYPGSPQ